MPLIGNVMRHMKHTATIDESDDFQAGRLSVFLLLERRNANACARHLRGRGSEVVAGAVD